MKKSAQWLNRSLVLGAFLLSGCVSDPNYNIDKLDNIDTSINVFGDGIELPIGKTEQISLADALKMAKLDPEAADSFLKKDENGDYSISVNGDYDLNDVIKDLHLEDLGNINGASFSKNVEYQLGDFDKNQFKIEGLNFSYPHEGFLNVNLDNINKKMPDIESSSKIKTELYKYLPADMDLGKTVGDFNFSFDNLIDVSGVTSIPGFSDLNGAYELPIQSYITSEIGIEQQNVDLKETLKIGDNANKIDDVANFKLGDQGKLKVSIKAENCPLTKGSITPDLNINISSILVLSDAQENKISLKNLVLDKDHEWTNEGSFPISDLANNFPTFNKNTKELNLDGKVTIDGSISIKDAYSTVNAVKAQVDHPMSLKATISLDGVVLDEMDITLGQGVGYEADEKKVEIAINNYEIPEGVASVEKVYFSEDEKLSVKISADGLSGIKSSDGTKHLSIVPKVEITFPNDIEIAEADANNKVTIKDIDLSAGDIEKKYTLVSVTPKCSGKNLTFTGNITAKVTVAAGGTFSSKTLPTSAAKDLVVKSDIYLKPKLKDYDVTLKKDEVTKQVSETRDFTFPMEGMADFGTFTITPKGSPVASLEFNLPTMQETDIIARNLVITIPQMISVDAKSIKIETGDPIDNESQTSWTFDSANNALKLNGKLPSKIEIPISNLIVEPKTGDDGKMEVKGTFKIEGGISVSKLQITRTTFEDINGKNLEVTAKIPTIEAQSIELTGDFNKSLDYEGNDIVILDSEAMKNIPEQVKSLDEVILDGVNALIEIKVTGLPDMNGSKFVLKGTKIELPEFLFGENDSHTIVLPDEIVISEGKAVVQKAQLTKLANVQLAGKDKITGDINFKASLYAQKPSVDLSTLKNKITAEVKIGVGNGENADNPGKIAISKAKVKVGYDLEQKQTLSFGDIPAELKGEDINLALNPEMHLELSTNFGAPVKGDIILTPIIADVPKESVTVTGIELPYSDDGVTVKVNKYAIGSNATVAPDEQEIKTDLSKLLTQISDSISVAIKVKIDDTKECVIYPGADYKCGMKYSLKVPMAFGDGFGINLNADIPVEASINDYLKMADGAKLAGTYLTTLPIGAELEIYLLDPDDKPIELLDPEDKSKVITHLTLTLDKSIDGKVEKDGTFGVELIFNDKANVNLKKVHLGIKVDASKNVNLNEKQYIQITNLSIGLPKGVNVEFQNK
ncbi:MAG: hypothetical protein MJY55_04020 [Bacteroidales bacterium]|nr:hypothetical protein [Bacteroidales bacterium]